MAEEQDPVAYSFKPANEGDHVIGIPARDLTESEVAEIKVREPVAWRNAITPHPTTGKAIYQKPAKASGKDTGQDAPAKDGEA